MEFVLTQAVNIRIKLNGRIPSRYPLRTGKLLGVENTCIWYQKYSVGGVMKNSSFPLQNDLFKIHK